MAKCLRLAVSQAASQKQNGDDRNSLRAELDVERKRAAAKEKEHFGVKGDLDQVHRARGAACTWRLLQHDAFCCRFGGEHCEK